MLAVEVHLFLIYYRSSTYILVMFQKLYIIVYVELNIL